MCCPFLLPAHLCYQCSVSLKHSCAHPQPSLVYACIVPSLFVVCFHPCVSWAAVPVPRSSSVLCVPDLVFGFQVCLFFIFFFNFTYDFPLSEFWYLFLDFHIGHASNLYPPTLNFKLFGAAV